jgi:hypothetical protein
MITVGLFPALRKLESLSQKMLTISESLNSEKTIF